MHLPPSSQQREHTTDTGVIDDIDSLKNASVHLRGDYRTSNDPKEREKRRRLFEISHDSSRYVTRTTKRSRDERRAKRSGVSKTKANVTTSSVGGSSSSSSIKRVVFGTW